MKKRISFSVTNDLIYDQRMIRICTSLSQNGYDVLLIGRKRPASPPLSTYPFRQKRLNCWFQSGFAFYAEYNIRLFFFLLFLPIDVLGAIDLDTILPNLLVSKLRRKIRVYDAHEYFTEVPEVIRRPGVQRVWEKVGDWAIPQFQSCYTVAEGLAKILTDRYGTPFQVIRNVPIITSELPSPSPSPPFVLLYQGVLNEGRGLEVLIQAMPQLEDTELWLAGEGDLSERLRNLTARLQLQNRVKFLGYLPPEHLRQLTPKAHLGLNLLENKGLSYYYSLANKAFDYIQAGLPSLQMDFPAYRTLQENYQVFHLLENLNVGSVVGGVNDLRLSSTKYNVIRQHCLEARQILNWKEEEQKLLRFYRKIIP